MDIHAARKIRRAPIVVPVIIAEPRIFLSQRDQVAGAGVIDSGPTLRRSVKNRSHPIDRLDRGADARNQGRIVDVLVKAFTEAIDLRLGSGRLGLRSLSVEALARMDEARTLTVIPKIGRAHV